MYYKTCSKCGAHLDPGELCECEKPYEDNKQKHKISLTRDACGQLKLGGIVSENNKNQNKELVWN